MQFGPQIIANAKVLVADDSPLILTDMKRLLRDMGFSSVRVFTAKDSKSLFKKLNEEQMDVIICDYNFGDDLNGKQIYEEICHLGLIPPWCAFIMLTGEKQLETVKAIVELEPDEYIIKPYTATVVKNRILRAVARKHALKELYELPKDSDIEKIESTFVDAEKTHSKYTPYVKRLYAETLIQCGYFYQGKLVYADLYTHSKSSWVMAGLLNACILNKDYDEANRLYNEWDKANIDRSALVHELKSKLCLIKGEVGKALLEIDRSLIKSTSMDRLYCYANLSEIHLQYKKSFQQFSSYRLSAYRTHRETNDIHVNVIRNLLLSTQPKQDDVLRVISATKQEMKKIKCAETDDEYHVLNELFHAHLEYIAGNNKRFLARLSHSIYKLEQRSKATALYCAKLALLAQQPELCQWVISRLPKWDENQTDWNHLFLLAQRRVLEHECMLATQEIENMLSTINQTIRDNSVDGANVAFQYFQQRDGCHHAALSMLSAMEKAFPKGLASNQVRELIFECEKILMDSPILNKSDRLVAKKKSDAAKQAFNRRFANVC
ncbi:response regulator [Vibrio ziniensis]|uniref:Response regulator n=1 Tax=Vibrio ziniensis TaxID=2711221 RepID=A0A6G7CQN5_9VIBR|nr:response regulator [Vibrio ziniensis]QIH44356.1 response regulator [Vibrio ziniensis]